MKLLYFAGSSIQQSQFWDCRSFRRPAPYQTALLERYRGSRLKGTKLTSTGANNARNDLGQALPQRLLDPVGVRNSVDWDNGLGHGHPTDLGIVITQAGENRGHYLPGLVRSHEPAQ